MALETIGWVIAVDLEIEDDNKWNADHDILVAYNEVVIPQDKTLTVSRDVDGVPKNYRPICGGVVHVAEDTIKIVSRFDGIWVRLLGGRYSWREPMREAGLMFILILPEQKTISKSVPLPVEAKAFNNRIALFWRAWRPDLGMKSVTFEWELQTITKNLEVEVDDINSFISKSGKTPRNYRDFM